VGLETSGRVRPKRIQKNSFRRFGGGNTLKTEKKSNGGVAMKTSTSVLVILEEKGVEAGKLRQSCKLEEKGT